MKRKVKRGKVATPQMSEDELRKWAKDALFFIWSKHGGIEPKHILAMNEAINEVLYSTWVCGFRAGLAHRRKRS